MQLSDLIYSAMQEILGIIIKLSEKKSSGRIDVTWRKILSVFSL